MIITPNAPLPILREQFRLPYRLICRLPSLINIVLNLVFSTLPSFIYRSFLSYFTAIYVHYPWVDSSVDRGCPKEYATIALTRVYCIAAGHKERKCFCFFCVLLLGRRRAGAAGSTSRRNKYRDSCTNILQGFWCGARARLCPPWKCF